MFEAAFGLKKKQALQDTSERDAKIADCIARFRVIRGFTPVKARMEVRRECKDFELQDSQLEEIWKKGKLLAIERLVVSGQKLSEEQISRAKRIINKPNQKLQAIFEREPHRKLVATTKQKSKAVKKSGK